MTRIAVVSAGLGEPSSTHLLADRLAAATSAALAGPVVTTTAHLRDVARDVADNLVTGFAGPKLRAVIEDVVGADALIAVTPTFNASYSGLFKSFVDVLEPTSLAGKPVLIGATGGSERHSLVLDHALRPLFAYLKAVVLPTGVYAASADWGVGSGLVGRIDRAGAELADLLAGRAPAAQADPYADVVPFERLLAGDR
ncbi:FMN reductase [Actinosynnema mirum]|uniref:NADPH-dependent FMN reductase n=1 Tax=Actinosynnema mirum (strain ATCC 29888 / DSM 43827 / JCM 3225 / NBRC 14064 / NCIMB 13271 / NRRL B-12336 / IMRU 3971 / 101) TaxID=446462 RepID=C6WII2_ACTMD|nr:FMN reductase [Actinosynnema mirum]ACU36225.1 NADPH-dependent FMN reductase [Actinosynnema mirum DSM 43827]